VTSFQSKSLVLNVYTLLAHTTCEEDVKAMPNSGRLLSTIIESIEKAFVGKPETTTLIEQLLETLKDIE
ncbi:unnamed protein product, partial [Rotaria magnacalcarata]